MSDFSLSQFKAVIFDMDSTLVNTHDYPLKATTWVLERHSQDTKVVNEKYITHLVQAYRSGIKQVVKGGEYRPPFEIVKSAIAEGLAIIGIEPHPDLVIEATEYFQELHIKLATLNPSVEDLLKLLRSQGIAMGIITNGFEGHIEKILKKLNVVEYFQTFVDTGVVKTYKPRREPFEYALAQLKLSPENALYIGDEFLADIVGAKNVGLSTVWINGRNHDLQFMLEKYGEEYQPDLVVESISRLIDFL